MKRTIDLQLEDQAAGRGEAALNLELRSDDFSALDEDVFDGYVVMSPTSPGLDLFDLVDDVLTFDYPAEHAIAPSLGVGRRVVQEIVVLDVDKELAGG